MAKFCMNCGKQLNDAVKFCASCGVQQPAPVQNAQPQQQPQAQPYIQPQYQYQQQYAPAPKKKSKMPLIVGGIIGVLAIVLIVVLIATNVFGLFGSGGDTPTDPNAPTHPIDPPNDNAEANDTTEPRVLTSEEQKFVGVWRNIYRDTYGTEPEYYLTRGIRVTYDDYLIANPEGTLFRFFDDGTFYRTFNLQTSYNSTVYTYTQVEKGFWSATEGIVTLFIEAFKDIRTAGFRSDWSPWRPPLNPNQTMTVGFGDDNDDRGSYIEVYDGITENERYFDKKYHKAELSAITAEEIGVEARKPDTEPERKTGDGSLVGVWRILPKNTMGTEISYYMTEGIKKTKDDYLVATPEGTIYCFYDDGTFYRTLYMVTTVITDSRARTEEYVMVEKGTWRKDGNKVYLTIEAFKDLTATGMKTDFTPWRMPYIKNQTLEIGFGDDNDDRGAYFEIYEGFEWYSMWYDYKYHKVDLSAISGKDLGVEK